MTGNTSDDERLVDPSGPMLTTIDQLPVGVLEFVDRGLVAVNARWAELTGLDAQASAGSGWSAALHPDDRPFSSALLGEPPSGGDVVCDLRLLRAGGRGEVWVQAHVHRVDGPDDQALRHVVTLTEISERKTTERRLRHMASHDSLTGSLSRAAFMDEVEEALDSGAEAAISAVLFIDLDHFKQVNDTYGHEAGDLVLVAACGRVHGALRGSDHVGRIGGDEIGVLCPALGSSDEAIVVANRIISALHEPFPIDGQPVGIGASIGIAVADEQAMGAEDLLRRADQAMYRAKAGGRGRWELADHRPERTVIDLDAAQRAAKPRRPRRS